MSATGIKELARLTSSLNEPPKESFVSPSKKGLARMWNAVRTTMSANTPKKAKAAGGLCVSLALAGVSLPSLNLYHFQELISFRLSTTSTSHGVNGASSFPMTQSTLLVA
jgi:hypothetical protein